MASISTSTSTTPTVVTPVTQTPVRGVGGRKAEGEHRLCLGNLRETIGQTAESFMCYGLGSCRYLQVAKAAEHLCQEQASPKDFPSFKALKKVYDCAVGNRTMDSFALDGSSPIAKIAYGSEQAGKLCARQSKAGPTNMMLNNYAELLKGNEDNLADVVFCADVSLVNKSENPKWKISAQTVLTKTGGDLTSAFNDKITLKEIRRCFKLCFDESLPLAFREMAQKHIKFVKVYEYVSKEVDTTTGQTTEVHSYLLEQIPPPWGTTKKEIEAFKQGMALRKEDSLRHPRVMPSELTDDEINVLVPDTDLSTVEMERMKGTINQEIRQLLEADGEEVDPGFDYAITPDRQMDTMEQTTGEYATTRLRALMIQAKRQKPAAMQAIDKRDGEIANFEKADWRQQVNDIVGTLQPTTDSTQESEEEITTLPVLAQQEETTEVAPTVSTEVQPVRLPTEVTVEET